MAKNILWIIIVGFLLATILIFPFSSARSSGISIFSVSAGNPGPHENPGSGLFAKSDKAANPHAMVTVSPTYPATPVSSGVVSVSSSPAGAQVFLDGSYRGITPVGIRGVSSGDHTLRLVLAGYADYNGGVTVSSGKISDFLITLIPGPNNGSVTPPFRWDDPVVLLTVLGIVTTVVGAAVTVASMIPWKKKESENNPDKKDP